MITLSAVEPPEPWTAPARVAIDFVLTFTSVDTWP